MAFAAFVRFPVRRVALTALLAVALPALAGTEPSHGSYLTEAQVDRLLWELVNDERYSHLQIAANYENLRSRLLKQACLVSAAPCLQSGEIQSHTITAEITPEQEELLERLRFTLHSASATQQPQRLYVSTIAPL